MHRLAGGLAAPGLALVATTGVAGAAGPQSDTFELECDNGETYWAKGKPQRLRANYHKTCGVRQFHACYSVGDDTTWGVVTKGTDNSLEAIRSCRAARPDGERTYVILDNLSAHKATKIKKWCAKHNVELCFTPTYSSWANPIDCHFGPLRDLVLNNSDHPNHTVLTRRLHAYLRCQGCTAAGEQGGQRRRRSESRPARLEPIE